MLILPLENESYDQYISRILKSRPNKKVEKQKTSDEWKRGFIDGYNEILEDLRNKKLIERYNA